MAKLSATDYTRIRNDISTSLSANVGVSPAMVSGILPIKDLQGKLYEVHVLAKIIDCLKNLEGCTIGLVNSGTLSLKGKGTPINKLFPYFTVHRNGKLIGELFTDTEFTSHSYLIRGGGALMPSDYHELDIAMFRPGLSGRPQHNDVLLAVECKATTIHKSTFRQLLGFRRELSLLTGTNTPTEFLNWPTNLILAMPGSVHMCYSWDSNILNYSINGSIYGILMVHETM